ncbi:MAG: von Willebrand factor type A domain-containing protein [Candidatus Omnitrophica bacterium]|nr:von Willebrand factor type A domain-containing protein [Candidatus Omnitrophota bacterium]
MSAMNNLNPEELKQLISLYMDGETTPEETQIVEEALSKDASLKKYYEDIRKVSNSLQSWKDESLSPDLEQKIRRSTTHHQNREDFSMKKFSNWIPVAVGMSVFVVVLGLMLGVQTSRQLAQMKIRDASQYLTMQTQSLGTASQYEPYYTTSEYKTKSSGRLRSASDDIAEQYAAGKTDRKMVATVPMKSIERNKDSADKLVRRENSGFPSARRDFPATEGAGPSIAMKAESRSSVMEAFSDRQRPVDEEQYWGQPVAPMPVISNTEEYDRIYDNEFVSALNNPLSTFSIDVDTASYSNVRRYLKSGQMPPKDAVRIEEMINYFTYDYPQPRGRDPISITTEMGECPWDRDHHLLLVGLQGKELQGREIPPSNLVFLIDVSGSMNSPDKLPLLKDSFRILVQQLRREERVSIVTYAGSTQVLLESTPGYEKERILNAIDRLQSGGSTAGASGIQLAYKIARDNFIRGGNNRIILATDGDFNVGVSSDSELTRLIEEKRKDGIFLSILGFGTGNYKDSKMEKLADHGNGTYHYIDSLQEGEKVLGQELGSTLFTIAKDVKVQIEFNPRYVKSYRLVGYENRVLAKEDFNDDQKDAGEMGAGHTVTALYEIVSPDSRAADQDRRVDPLKYMKQIVNTSRDLLTVKVRYKDPDGWTSQLIEESIHGEEFERGSRSPNFQFASAVAEFGLLLRDSQFKGQASYRDVLTRAHEVIRRDHQDQNKEEFIDLVEKAMRLDRNWREPAHSRNDDPQDWPIEPRYDFNHPGVEEGYRQK